MALLCSRVLGRNIGKSLRVSSRNYAIAKETPESMELATGPEKWQLQQKEIGNEDPFNMKAIKRQASTKANPNMIPSAYDCRIIGCICEEDSSKVVWMWLFKGEPRRCYCGHWFKLCEYKPT